MAEYVVAQASVLIVPSLKKFQKQLEIELRRNQALTKPVTIDVEANTKKFIAEGMAAKKALEANPVNIRFRVLDATKQITEIRHKYEDTAREMKKGLVLNLKVAGMSLLPQLASGLAAVNASIVQLSQSAVLLPGILAGVGSSVSALLTGVRGVKDAFKEYGDAQKNAAQEGLKARNSAINVKNAYRDLGRSIRDAQRNLEDLNAQLRDAPLDEADAIIRVAEARAEAADKAQKSGLQQQKDLIALQRAENDLVTTRLRNSRLVTDAAEANAKGVAGADSVREATDRLSKAQDEAATQATKLSDSLKELSPNAQKFVTTVTGMADEWSAFRMSVQDKLFAGLDEEITRLGQVSLPTLEKGLGGIADALNGNVKAAFKALGSETNQGFFEKIFGDTAKAQEQLSDAFDPFVDSFLRLASNGTGFLPRLTEGLTDLLTRFDNFIVRAEGDGSLDRWTNDGIDALKQLGNSLINVMSIMDSLSEAFTGSGGKSFLQLLEEGSKRLADFLNTDEGQDRLKKFFVETREELAKWKPFLEQLPGLMQNVAAAGQQWANILVPILTNIGKLLAGQPAAAGAVLTAFLAWKGIFPILKGLYSGIGTVNKVFDLFKPQLDNSGQRTTGFKNKVGELSSALISPAGLVGAATLAATWIGINLANAHIDAEAAAQRQKDVVDQLRQSLDDVTGSATKATNALVAKDFREGINAATGKTNGDLLKNVSDPNALINKVAAGDLDGALSLTKGATGSDIETTEFWSKFGPSVREFGMTSDDVAKAVNGEPDAKKRFEDWNSQQTLTAGPFGTGMDLPWLNQAPGWLVQGAENAGAVTTAPDLLDIQNQLPDQVRTGSQLQGMVYEKTLGLNQAQSDIRTDNTRGFGRFRLKPGSPFEALGVVADPGVNQDRGGLVVKSQPEGPALDEFRNNGVTFTPDGTDRFIVSISPDSVLKYFERFNTGGLISGPGSGTSDSILARLSRGEFIVNAKSTQKHLPLLEQLNGGGEVPGFSDGGLFGGSFGAPPVVPAPKPQIPLTATGMLNHVNSQKPPAPSFIGGGGAASAGETAAAASIPKMEIGSSKPSRLGAAGSAVGNFFKGALGLGAPGYEETSTAKVTFRNNMSVSDSAWNNLNAPLPSGDKPNPSAALDSRDKVTSGLYPWLKKGWWEPDAYGKSAPKPAAPPVKPPVAPPKPVPKPSPTVSSPPVKHGTVGAPGAGNGVPHLGNMAGGIGPVSAPSPLVSGGLPAMIPGGNLAARVGNSEDGLQVNTIGIKRVLENMFPGIVDIGGFREDAIEDHPSGKAIDVMIPNWDTPEGKAYGDQIVAFLRANGSAMGVDSFIWQDNWQDLNGNTSFLDLASTQGPTQGHMDHIHIKTTGGGFPTGTESYGLSSIANMPAALTPTGVGLPQLSYTQGSGGGLPSVLGGDSSGKGGLRLPSPQEYADYVAQSWMGTLQNMVRNAGSIGLNFLGSFFGLDLSQITGTANSIIGGIDLPKEGEGDDELSLPADEGVANILGGLGGLPPGYEDALASASGAKYDPKGGAEQWRPVVRKVLAERAAVYGIKNIKAWEDALIRQINTESGGNPGAANLNDTDGKGGTQQVFGIGQFLPTTFAAHNVTGGDINDPVAQIYAMVDYVASKYGMDSTGGPNQIGRGVGYASGGRIKGKGNGRSDSIIARVSNGEFIVKAQMAQKHLGLLQAINANQLPGFSDGGLAGFVDGGDLLDFGKGIWDGGADLVSGLDSAIKDPIGTVKGMAPLVGLGGDGAPGVGDSWLNLGKSAIAYDEWTGGQEAHAAGRNTFDIATAFLTGGYGAAAKGGAKAAKVAVKPEVKAAEVAAKPEVKVAEAAVAPPKISLSRNLPYTKGNIPSDPNHIYRGISVDDFSSVEGLFGKDGIMTGAGKGGTDRLSFSHGFPLDIYTDGIVKSNIMLEGKSSLIGDGAKASKPGQYGYVDQLELAKVLSGETPIRVWQRKAAPGQSITDQHAWEVIFDSFPKKASGGSISGPGSGTSDSILARVSRGEYIVKASSAQKNLGLLNAINSGLPGFADGMMWPTPAPAPVTPPPAPVAPPPAPPVPVPAAPDPVGPQASAEAGVPAPPTDPASPSPVEGEQTALSDIGAALGGIGGALGEGAEAPEGGTPEGDPRSALGAAPQNLDHNKPAVSQGIQAAAGAIAGAVSTAMQAASVAANASAPGSGQGVSSAAGIVNGMIAAGGTAVSGAVNILSSLGVGSVTPSSSTAGAYGSPLLPSAQGQDPYKGPAVVNNWNGGVHTSNNDEFYRIQQRRELQAAAPSLPPGA
jgi:hypothetical protein